MEYTTYTTSVTYMFVKMKLFHVKDPAFRRTRIRLLPVRRMVEFLWPRKINNLCPSHQFIHLSVHNESMTAVALKVLE